MAEEREGVDVSVQPNVILTGALSGEPRQVDVLIDIRSCDMGPNHRIMVDAKLYRRRLTVKDVEAFEGMMRDCRAAHGILVAPSGWSPAAARRAQAAITIQLLTYEAALEFEYRWDPCLNHECSIGRKRHGVVLWGEIQSGPFWSEEPLTMWVMVGTGKCADCHAFHVWCWDCGSKFAVPDDTEQECDCNRLWRAQPDAATTRPTSMWLLMRSDHREATMAFDRRPLR